MIIKIKRSTPGNKMESIKLQTGNATKDKTSVVQPITRLRIIFNLHTKVTFSPFYI